MNDDELVPAPHSELVRAAGVPSLLDSIRPAWQAKDLITRVRRLLTVDPSSACQRIFNAAIHDLREKVAIAGLDIAREAAQQHKLPPVERPEDVENYPTEKLIDLAYRVGLLAHPEWRRLSRVYEIRRDLEHEDDQYQAGVEDLIYVFKTCVEVVLSRDPIHLLRVTDVKEIVEQPSASTPDQTLVEDYHHAPQPRQEEIMRFLVSVALDGAKPDIVRQNAFQVLQRLEPLTQNPVKLSIASHFQERLGRRSPDLLHARVAFAAGIFPYLKQAQRIEFFRSVLAQLRQVGHNWRSFPQHGEVLRNLTEVGGLTFCPSPVRAEILEWLVLAYMGSPGGYGTWGHNRSVFYSDTAAPIVRELLAEAASQIRAEVAACETLPSVQGASQNAHVARRFQELLDLVESRTET